MLVPTKPQTREIHCAPKHHPCPRCGVKGVRDRLCVRLVRSLAFGREAWLHIHYAEYKARCGCCKTFRSCPSDVMPKGDYDDRVRRTVVDRLIEDDLNVERTRLSMKREFLLDLSVGFIYDCLDWALRQLNLSEARNEAIAFFSGTLCIDELHLGKRIALVATDPLSNRIVAFALISVNDQAHMRRFLLMLKHWGLRPALVVSDGSTLYPALLREILPWAAHQLCIFHVIQDINKKVLDALRRLRNCQSRKGNSGRKRKRGGRSKAAKKQRERRGPTLKEKSAFVFKHRFLIVKRAEKLNEKEKQALAQMIEYLPELRVLTQFAQEVYKLWQTDQSQKVA